MGNILEFTGLTSIKEPVDIVLEKAKLWGMDRCIILGFGEGAELIFGGSFSESGEILLLLELGKMEVLSNGRD